MRNHFTPLHMGLGEETTKNLEELTFRLARAFSLHSGLQQGNGHIPIEEREKGKLEIQQIVEDIAYSLGVTSLTDYYQIFLDEHEEKRTRPVGKKTGPLSKKQFEHVVKEHPKFLEELLKIAKKITRQ